MTCPARNQKLTPAACPEHILGVSDSHELLRCRACPRGQALMATVGIGDNFYGPEEDCTPNTEEKPVEKQTYTMKELAVLLGVPPKAVSNARYMKTKNPLPGSLIAAVRDGMTAQGVTWDQVVNSHAVESGSGA